MFRWLKHFRVYWHQYLTYKEYYKNDILFLIHKTPHKYKNRFDYALRKTKDWHTCSKAHKKKCYAYTGMCDNCEYNKKEN